MPIPSYPYPDRNTSTSEAFHPTTFLRYNRQLRALLLETQAWFSARDLSKLIAWPLNERTTSKLDADQRRTLWLETHGRTEETLMISESGLYALLVHHYHPEHRSLRHWITNEVIAALRDAQEPPVESMPSLSLLQWPGMSLSMLHWQNEPWIRLRDVPQVLPWPGQGVEEQQGRSNGSWFQGAARFFQGT